MLPIPALSIFRIILFSFGKPFQLPPTFFFPSSFFFLIEEDVGAYFEFELHYKCSGSNLKITEQLRCLTGKEAGTTLLNIKQKIQRN